MAVKFGFHSASAWTIGVCGFVLLLRGGAAFADCVSQDEIVEHTFSSPARDLWTIYNPDVRHPSYSPGYPKFITLLPGDRVILNAGGCVQTGGKGKTWKRYVDPQGDNSDHLYHGLVRIPGVTEGFQWLKRLIGRPLLIPKQLASDQPLVLSLGYEDEGYDVWGGGGFSDNGYCDPDSGSPAQCTFGPNVKNEGRAWLTIEILHEPCRACERKGQ
jgi:hypothetical protein